MKKRHALAAAPLALTAALAPAGQAAAVDAPPPPVVVVNANTVKVSTTNPDVATVHVSYRCSGTGVHLWASVKQGAGIDPANGQTASDYADAWYETPDGPTPKCDGAWHSQPVRVGRNTDHPTKTFTQLQNGQAWLQFVIFAVPDGGGFWRGATQQWVSVRR